MSGTTVANIAQLNAAIAAADGLAAGNGTVTISLGANITLDGTALDLISLQTGVTLDLVGNGYTLDGGGGEQGLFVYAGTVDVSNLAIDDMLAQGGNGTRGGGGGAGLGGGLFIGSSVNGDAGNVTLTNTSFSGNAAYGGNGALGTSGHGGGLDGLGAPYGGGAGSQGDIGGNGGFGGGGGGAFEQGGTGGWGGGGGGGPIKSYYNAQFGWIYKGRAGFGGGTGGTKGGGGGLGAGGDIFVESGATLAIGGSGTLGAGRVGGGAGANPDGIIIASGGNGWGSGIYLQGAGHVLTFAPSGTETVAGVIADDAGATGNGGYSHTGVLLNGSGTLLYTVANQYAGGTTIDAGTLEIAAGGGAGSGAIAIAGGMLAIDAGATSGSGQIVISQGTLAVAAGGNTGAGGVSFSGGTLAFANGATIGGAGLFVTGGQLAFGAGQAGGSGALAGNSAVTVSGGTLALNNGASLGSGALTVSGGTVTVASGATLGASTVTVSGGTLTTVSATAFGSNAVAVAGGLLAIGAGGALGSGGIALTGGTLSVAAGGSLTLGNLAFGGGTLDLAAGAVVGSAPIAFAASSATLRLDGAITGAGTLANPLMNFTDGDAIDLRGLAFVAGAAGTVNGNTLTIASGTASESVTLANSWIGGATVVADGYGGSLVTALPIAFPTSVSSLAQLNAALLTVARKTSGTYSIDLGANIALGGATLDAIALQSGVTLDLIGNGYTLDGGGSQHGLEVLSGAVTLETLAIAGMVAQTANTPAGLAGLGGGLYVGAAVAGNAGSVTLDGVTFANDSAVAAGGLLAGADIFVQSGAALSVNGGGTISAGNAGSATSDIYLQGASPTLTFDTTGTLGLSATISDDAASSGNPAEGHVALALTGPGTVVLEAANTYTGGTALNAGTLEITATGAAGSGAIAMNGSAVTVQFDTWIGSATTLAPTIANLHAGNDIDLRGLAYTSGATDTINGGTLEVVSGGHTAQIALTNPNVYTLSLSNDGAGGTMVHVDDPSNTVTTIGALNNLILAADQATSGTVTIALGGDIALDGTVLDAFNLAPGVTVDLVGNGHTLDGGGANQGLFVYAGAVNVDNIAIDNMLAHGGNATTTGGGGGMGAGGGLFIGANVAGNPGRVTLTNVGFSGDAAVGGNGAGNTYTNVNSYLVFNTAGGNMSDATAPGVGGGYLGAWMGEVGGGPYVERYAQFGGGGDGDTNGYDYTWAIAISGGFGGGGGGIAGPGYQALASGGFGGAPGAPNSYGATGGGGGLGAGGDIFVQQGGSLTIAGGSTVNAGTVSGGLTYNYYNEFYDFGQGPAPQAYGAALGNGIYMQGAGNGLNFAPDGTQTVAGVIADDAGSAAAAYAIAYAGDVYLYNAINSIGIPYVEANYMPGSVGITVDGTGTVLLTAQNTYSGGSTIKAGTLEIGASGSAGGGPITFAGYPAAVRVDTPVAGTVTLANAIGGLVFGDTIDLAGLAYTSGAQVSESGLTLEVTSGANTVDIGLANAPAGVVVPSADGTGGTKLSVQPLQPFVMVSTLSQLDAALGAAGALTSGTMTIELAANIALGGGALNAIEVQSGVTLDLLGNGNTLDGGNTQQGLFVYSGVVNVSDLAIDDMVARGGDGISGGGGGAGLGGGLFVGSAVAGDAGTVTLTNVSFANDAAVGGNGTARPSGSASGTVGIGGGISGQTLLGTSGRYDGGYGAGGNFANTSKGWTTVAPGFGGGAAVAGAPGFGGGVGNSGGGGGLAAGGDIFVQSGGTLTIAGGGTIATGAVVAGSGWHAPPANAWGSGLYLEGSNGLRFAPTGTQTIAGVIADGEGSTGYDWLGQTSLTVDGPGTLLLSGANAYSGGTTVQQGTLEIGAGGAPGSGAITFAGAAAELRIDAAVDGHATWTNSITGLVPGDALDLRGLPYIAGMSSSLVGDTLTVTGGSDSDVLQVSETTAGSFAISPDGAGGTLLTEILCFLTGTRIATPAGDVAVETLQPGDLVALADGGAAPVRWVGRHTIARRFSDPMQHWPVRIREGALGDALPQRDLLVTPGHALRLDDILVQAGALVNGSSIARESWVPETFVYWHVELDTHALLLAEGVAAESFLDTYQELAFDNHATRAEPAAPAEELSYPRCKSARQLPKAVRDHIARRAARLDQTATAA